jgi:hypothetical protein
VKELALEKFFADEEVAKEELKENYNRRYQIDHNDLIYHKCMDDKYALYNTELL